MTRPPVQELISMEADEGRILCERCLREIEPDARPGTMLCENCFIDLNDMV